MKEIIYSMWPGETYFGDGAAGEAGEHARRLGGSRAFVVTDQGVRKARLLDRVLAPFDKAGVEFVVFDGVEANRFALIHLEAFAPSTSGQN